MIRLFGVLAALLLAIPLEASASERALPERPHFTNSVGLEEYRRALYRKYATCSEAAATRELSRSEVAHCVNIYLSLKLSFLHGVSLERYHQMPVKTKIVANEKGYAAFRAWLHRNIAWAN